MRFSAANVLAPLSIENRTDIFQRSEMRASTSLATARLRRAAAD